MTKLSPTLPKDIEDDGLASLNGKLITQPYEQHVVVMIVDCKKFETDIDSGYREATARVVACEPIRDEDAADQVRAIMAAAHSRRLNRPSLFDEPEKDDGSTTEAVDIVDAELVPELETAGTAAIEA